MTINVMSRLLCSSTTRYCDAGIKHAMRIWWWWNQQKWERQTKSNRSAQGRMAGASNVTSTVAGTFLQTFQFFCQQFGIQNTAGMPWSRVSAAKVATMTWRPANVQPLTFAVRWSLNIKNSCKATGNPCWHGSTHDSSSPIPVSMRGLSVKTRTFLERFSPQRTYCNQTGTWRDRLLCGSFL